MQVKVLFFDHETNKFQTVANINVPKHQLGFNNDEKDACEYAFARTQNIFGSWSRDVEFEDGTLNQDYSENVQVVAALPEYFGKQYGHRSSQVGDLFVVNGNIYVCKVIGFELYQQQELV